jgi:outer membrane protein TolC
MNILPKKKHMGLRIASIKLFSFLLIFILLHLKGFTQKLNPSSRDSLQNSQNSSGKIPGLSLEQCIEFSLKNSPYLNQTLINQKITGLSNAIALSGWLPQVGASGSLIHYIQIPSAPTITTNTSGSGSSTQSTNKTTTFTNSFIPQLAISQSIFTPGLLYALKVAPYLNTQSRQITDSTKIYLVSAVSKSFYNILLTLEQIDVYKEDTARLGKSYRDAYYQYKGGIVDETNYEEALITLNNSKSQLRQAEQSIKPNYSVLKQIMGYPLGGDFNVRFDTSQMVQAIYLDTTQQLQFEHRIEFQQIQNNKKIQAELTRYYRHNFLPSIGAFYNYNLAFENNSFSQLFSKTYPNSLIGVSISVPIFTGFARVRNVQKAKLEEKLIDWNEVALKLEVEKEYQTALSTYKTNFYNLKLDLDNIRLSKRVYFVTDLQYKQGIIPYLNVITAESNLITSEINYLNTLFQVLSSKIDLEKAMGNVTF